MRALWKWAGPVLTAVAVVGAVVCFVLVGLDKADKIASVLGSLLGILGLGMAVLMARRGSSRDDRSGAVENTITEAVFHGPVVQGRDFEYVDLGRAVPRPAEGEDEEEGSVR